MLAVEAGAGDRGDAVGLAVGVALVAVEGEAGMASAAADLAEVEAAVVGALGEEGVVAVAVAAADSAIGDQPAVGYHCYCVKISCASYHSLTWEWSSKLEANRK